MDIANVDQANAWDGHEGEVWATNADRYDRAVGHIQRWFDEQGIVRSGDRVLDLGCGNGRSTLRAARATGNGSALGIDLSSSMLEVARARAQAEGVANASFLQADAQVHGFPPEAHDLAISAFGAMFFGDPVAAFANIGDTLLPGGRLGLVAWRALAENEWLLVQRRCLAAGRELPEPPTRGSSPFGLSDPAVVHEVLAAAGYHDIDLTPIDEPMDLGQDAADALAFVVSTGVYQGLTQDLDDAAIAHATDLLQAELASAETPAGVLLPGAAWLITAAR